MRVALLAGGRSAERDVSLASAASVRDGLQAAGHEVSWVDLRADGTWWCDGEEVVLRAGRGLLGCDVCFPALHGPYGEDGTVQGLLELLGVPYVGSGVLASAACMDKLVAKDLMAAAGVDQVAYALAERGGEVPDVAALGTPVWVKPANLGSSVGIARVADPATELVPALEAAFALDARVIVEASATGLEVECSVLGSTEAPATSTPGEIVLTGGEGGWYDYEAKYTPGSMRLQVPARISATAAARVQELARRAFTLSGCSGLARADFFVDGERVLLNELNTMPGFTATSVYAALWAHDGLAYPDLVDRLCALALER